jgi:peptide deformylase
MAILKILTFPDPLLREKAEIVSVFDKDLEKFCKNLLETMYDAPGVRLAAIQVGMKKRIIAVDVDYKIEGEDDDHRVYVDQNPQVFINPIIKEKSGNTTFKEGCLSVPGFTEEVQRFNKITIDYHTITGEVKTLTTDGFLAIAIQHEMDHLEGKLFIDRLSEIKKNLIKGKLLKQRSKKFERSKFHVEL